MMGEHEKPSNNPFAYDPSQIRKTFAAVAGFAVTVLSTVLAVNADVIPADWLWLVQVVILVAGSYGVFAATNRPPGPVVPVDDNEPIGPL